MTQKIYVVEGRKFRTEADYQNALKDQQVIENLRMQTKKMSLADQKKLLEVIRSGKCRFHSILGQDYMEELSEEIKRQEAPKTSKTTHTDAADADKMYMAWLFKVYLIHENSAFLRFYFTLYPI